MLAPHISGPPLRRRVSTVLAVLSAAAMAVLGVQTPSQAAAPTAVSAKAPTAGDHVPYETACGAAKKGEATCYALRRTDVASAKGLRTASAPGGFGPADLRSAYNLPAGGGAGQTIAIVDAFDDPTAEEDLAVYREQYGLPACTTDNGCFTKVDQRGGTNYPQPDPGWAGEISLDLDMVSAIAPNAHILLVEADTPSFDDLGAAVDQAVALGAKFVSNSYGTDYRFGSGEDPSGTVGLDVHYNHPGVAMVASSGDYGYGVSYPAASPYVTAVGGTSLTADGGTGRGWSESAWDGAGSGCSLYEPKPAFQTDTGCENRAVADVSAVADPATPVAVYQTYGGGGWAQFGGTSAGSPIIAAVYANAGTPVAGTYPNSYPYAAGAGLYDVTDGSNGTCAPAYLCTGAAGYDGPTGLGTPNGLRAFRTGPHGTLSGTVTDQATGKPLAGASVSAGPDNVTHSGADGRYTLGLPVATYDVTVDAYGYATGTAKDVAVTEGGALTRDFALNPVPSQTVAGKVTDDSGHGWPLYARITVDGVPGGPVWTDPATGAFTVDLPQGHDYTLRVEAALPGYTPANKSITVADAPQSLTLSLPADPWKATTPGYAVHLDGPTEHFASTESAPQGWRVVNADGTEGGWSFDDPAGRGNQTGGDGAFAIAENPTIGEPFDAQLISPAFDLTDASDPELAFDAMYFAFGDKAAQVDASSDDGATWKSLWTAAAGFADHARVEIPLTGLAGEPNVRVRFHFVTDFAWWWGIDDVFVGDRAYTATPGGLVTGTVTDANTGKGLVGATVTGKDDPKVTATTVATPEDPALGDGLYLMFSPHLGKHDITAARPRYTELTKTVNVATDSAVAASYKLKAGQLTVTPDPVTATVGWGKSATRNLTVKNTGGAPTTVTLDERAGGFQIQNLRSGAPLQTVKGHFSPHASKTGPAASGRKTVASPSGAAWQTAPSLPEAALGNAVGTYKGKVYSGFGYTGLDVTNAMYVLDPVVGSWTRAADAADRREAPSAQFVDGKFHVVGGWNPDNSTDPKLEIYDPVTDTWTTGAPAPVAYAGQGNAALDGKLYTVGGCNDRCGTAEAYAYDPDADAWSRIADYPEKTSWESCAGVNGKLYCAGGDADSLGESKHAYVYDPVANTWTALPDLPIPLWGSSYTAADDQLVISSGITGNALTNQGFAYSPEAGTWSALPNANVATYRGGAGLGLYKVGGGSEPYTPSTAVEFLPGYDQGGSTDVTWLRTSTQHFTLQPGASTTVTVTLDASVPEIAQPGDFTAQLALDNDSPYGMRKVAVSLHVDPPKTWGKITGTIRGVQSDGTTKPLAGATVEIDSWAASYSLRTAADGTYSLWLDSRNNPLSVIVAKDGYRPVATTVKIKKGATVTGDFTLKKQ
ncbi:carboxypeptidase regulatory-like domain-containing protein [Streptomyces sp. NPDC058691]|uniref:carboxypeptidase regulatory-like domain-containing protein n=1 Tax=Streptomyces sp. NPDC058691 TaxID=3346601 RepID=UPI003668303A